MSDGPITTLDTRSTFHMARLADGVLQLGFPDRALEVTVSLDDLAAVGLVPAAHDEDIEILTDDTDVEFIQGSTSILTVAKTDLRTALEWIPIDEADEVCAREHFDEDADGWMSEEQVEREIVQPKARVMKQWHNDHHDGTVRFCYEQPCRDLREVVEG